MKIKPAKLRGVESQGMLCSARELELSEEADGLHELPTDAPLGTALGDYLDLKDNIIEIDLTPNRGDCFSIRGIAREIATRNKKPSKAPDIASVEVAHNDTFPIEIAADSCCARFCGRIIRGVDATRKSPLWMVEKLRRSGIRSISPAVDVTNYVMLEMGQPMHAFDLSKLNGGIRVRPAAQGEKVKLLDGREIALDDDTTVIADHSKAVAIAGIMGGDETGVTDVTTDILLEAALFVPLGVAGRPRRYNAYTDSAQRYERGVDSELQPIAMERATELLLAIMGGQAGPIHEVRNDNHVRSFTPVTLRRARLDTFLGVGVADDEVTSILQQLGMQTEFDGQNWTAISPSWRYDIAIEEDLIEEIARLYGYNRIPRTNPQWAPQIRESAESRMPAATIPQMLIDRGYQEAVSYSFVDERQKAFAPDSASLALANPISAELSEMRHTLWLSLCDIMQSNFNRQQHNVKLFEYGLKFVQQSTELKQIKVIAGLVAGNRSEEHWSETTQAADFYDVKADVEAVLGAASDLDFDFEVGVHPALHPGITACIKHNGNTIGWIGKLHPKVQKSLDLSASVRRDLAFTIDEKIPFADIRACVKEHAPAVVKDVRLVDVYAGKGITNGLRSVALGLILQDFSSTLADSEIDVAVSKVLEGLENNLGATLRK